MRILIVDPPHPVMLERFDDFGWKYDLEYDKTKEELLDIVAQYDGLVVRSSIKVDKTLIDAAKNWSFIARYGVGTEHIDLEYAAQKKITVFTSPEGSKDAVAEHSMGMLLMLMNHLSRADSQVKAGQWLREPNRGVEIKGKTVGILGYGNMGKALAKRLQGFECKVIAYDKYKKQYGDEYAEEVALETLFSNADILSIHIPYMKDNHYFIDGSFIDSFRKPLYIVNTARGLVLNTQDLVERIEEGKVMGAALD
ncbi:MAG: NAD(P)-dependent oxidoreductase, partial [Bacteroidota bacterium]